MRQVTEPALLAPVEIWEVALSDSIIKFFQPLILTPTFMPDDPDEPDENEYLKVDVPELAISSHGTTTEELVAAIRSDIRFAWRHFVRANDNQLAPDALIIKKSYLAIAEAIDE
jgi:hypothetical protein